MPIILKQDHGSHNKVLYQPNNMKTVFQQLRHHSEKLIDENEIKDIQSFISLKQSTAYQVSMLTQNEYVAHQFTKISSVQAKKETIDGVGLITKMFLLNHQLQSNNTKIRLKNAAPQKLHNFHQKLKYKLSQIKNNIEKIRISNQHQDQIKKISESNSLYQSQSFNLSTSLNYVDRKRLQLQLEKIAQFKQPSYWIKDEEKSLKIKQYLQHHRRQHLKRQKRCDESMQKFQQRVEEVQKRKIELKKQFQQQIIKKGLQKTLQYKDRREDWIQNHQNQVQKIEQFLQRINPTKRLYKQLENRYKSRLEEQEQSYRQKLEKIKQEHSPIQKEEIQEHRIRHQEYRQSLKEDLKEKRDELAQKLQQINQQLKNLFRSKKHQQIAEKQILSPYKRSLSEIIQRKSKIKDFSLKVKQNFKPQISERKRQQLEQSIRLLQLSKDNSKRKVYKNGQLQFMDKQHFDSKKKGLEYLHFLRKYLQGKPQKSERPVSTSLLGIQKQTKIDYLRENKPIVKLKASLQEWKKVIKDSSFTFKDKYTFLKESVSTLQHKALEKELEARNLKRSSQELDKKEEFDKLYLESIEAKMAMLNNLMLFKK